MTAISQNDVHEILRRAELARDLCGWSDERHNLFCAEVLKRAPVAKASNAYLNPEDFGLDEEFVTSPGVDKRMTPDERIAMGAYQAEMTVRSWAADPVSSIVFDDPQTCAVYAHAYMDRGDIDAASMDEEGAKFVKDFSLSEMSACYDGNPVGWLRREHRNAILDGRTGYEDMILQKIEAPCVYMRRGGEIEIADGWHRTAAAILVGDDRIEAVEINVPVEKDPDVSP